MSKKNTAFCDLSYLVNRHNFGKISRYISLNLNKIGTESVLQNVALRFEDGTLAYAYKNGFKHTSFHN